MLDATFLVLYIALVAVVLWASKSLATGLVHLLFGTALTGSALALWGIPGWTWTYRSLQAWLVLGLAATAAYAWHTTRDQRPAWPRRRTLITLAPPAAIALALLATRLLATDAGGPLAGVGYLITHTAAEDNAKWLNATSQLAAGNDVLSQETALGAPLLMLMVVAATAISVASTLLYGGVNQVAVAADTLILTQHALAIAAPLALAPIAAATWTLRRRARQRATPTTAGRTGPRAQQIPALALWTGMGILAATSILLTRYGHLTLQYTLIVLALWATCFLAPATTPRTRLLATLTVAACSQVWFPINVLAAALLAAAVAWTTTRAVTAVRTRTTPDWLSLGLSVGLAGLMAGYLASSFAYALGVGTDTSLPLFSIGGGTEATTALQLGLMAASVIGASAMLAQSTLAGRGRWRPYAPLTPVLILLGYGVVVVLVDFWKTGEGPGYGSRKLLFAVVITVLVSTLPLAITRIDLGRAGTTAGRLIAVVAVGFLLIADTLVPRAIIELRPQAWPADLPANYWSTAEVRPVADQPLTSLPIGCVFIRGDAQVPGAFPWVDAQNLGQQTYACTRMLIGLSGLEKDARPIVDWLANEWTSGRSTWATSSRDLLDLPAEVVSRDFILLNPYNQIMGNKPLVDVIAEYPKVDAPPVPGS